MAVHMTREQKQMACRLDAKGLSHKAIARDLNYSLNAIGVAVAGNYRRNAPADEWTPAPGRLSAHEREEILVGLSRGESMSSIARGLGRAPSTVTREVAANGGLRHYGAWKGRCRARASSLRPKTAKLDHPALVQQVTAWLEELWSPEEIAERLRIVFPDDPMMHVSHETIYQSLFVHRLRQSDTACSRANLRGLRSALQRCPAGLDVWAEWVGRIGIAIPADMCWSEAPTR